MLKLQILGICAPEGTQHPNSRTPPVFTYATGLNDGTRARLPFSSLYWISAVCSLYPLSVSRANMPTRVTSPALPPVLPGNTCFVGGET